MLSYENQMFLDVLHEDGLLVAARGLGLEHVLYSLIKAEIILTCLVPNSKFVVYFMKDWVGVVKQLNAGLNVYSDGPGPLTVSFDNSQAIELLIENCCFIE